MSNGQEGAQPAIPTPSTPQPPQTPPASDPDGSPAPHAAINRSGQAPLFSEVSQAYIDVRIAADGAGHKDIEYLRLRT